MQRINLMPASFSTSPEILSTCKGIVASAREALLNEARTSMQLVSCSWHRFCLVKIDQYGVACMLSPSPTITTIYITIDLWRLREYQFYSLLSRVLFLLSSCVFALYQDVVFLNPSACAGGLHGTKCRGCLYCLWNYLYPHYRSSMDCSFHDTEEIGH